MKNRDMLRQFSKEEAVFRAMKHCGFSCFTCRLFKQDQWGTWRCLDDDWERLCRGKFEEWLERKAGRC